MFTGLFLGLKLSKDDTCLLVSFGGFTNEAGYLYSTVMFICLNIALIPLSLLPTLKIIALIRKSQEAVQKSGHVKYWKKSYKMYYKIMIFAFSKILLGGAA